MQVATTDRGLVDAVSRQYNMPSPSSCLGLESLSGSGEPLAINTHELHNLRDIMLPQGGLFADFFKLPNSSHGLLVSRNTSGKCWDGTEVIGVHRDIQRHWTDYRNSSQALANQAACKRAKQLHKDALNRTCCSDPERAIMEELKSIADKNRALLCQNQSNNSTTNPYCEQCGSGQVISDK